LYHLLFKPSKKKSEQRF